MPVALTVTLIALAGCAVAMTCYWIIVAVETVRAIRTLPTLRDALSRPEAHLALVDSMPSVCVIIPAHNEGRNIETVARTLLAQDYRNFRVVFVLDRCTDDTLATLRAAIGADPRVRIIEVDQCPDDWAGKVHAVWTGWTRSPEAQQAELLCFADADTIWDPQALRAAVALQRWRNLGLLSLMTNLTHETWFERVVQPIACYELLTQYPPRRVNRTERIRAVANGQFMMFTRACYDAIGTHAKVKGELLEDQRMAKLAVKRGHLLGFLHADGLLHCRMYREYDRFRSGWKRIYTELAQVKPWRLRRYALRLFMFSVVFPVGTIAGLITGAIATAQTGHWLAWTCLSVCASVLGLWIMLLIVGARWARTPISSALYHIAGAWITVGILLSAARDITSGRGIRWGGRRYVREAGVKGHARAMTRTPPPVIAVADVESTDAPASLAAQSSQIRRSP